MKTYTVRSRQTVIVEHTIDLDNSCDITNKISARGAWFNSDPNLKVTSTIVVNDEFLSAEESK